MGIDHLTGVLDAAVASVAHGDGTLLEGALRDNGWTLAPAESVDTGEELRWVGPGPASAGVPLPSAWTATAPNSAASFGFIVAAASDEVAERLRVALCEHVEGLEGFAPLESDDVWTGWSDGTRDVRVGIHRSSGLHGTKVLPSVQVSVEPSEVPVPDTAATR